MCPKLVMTKKGRNSLADLEGLIYRVRKDLGMTQAQFAHEMGVSVTTVARWETRTRRPDKWKLRHMLLKLPPGQAASLVEAAIGQTREEVLAELGATAEMRDVSPDDDLLRSFNDASIGLNLLYEAARAGHTGARHVLADLADRINKRAGDWRQMKYVKLK